MDRILSGILASDKAEPVKKALFQKISNAASMPQTVEVVVKVLEISASMTLDGNSTLETENGINIFKLWAKYNLNTFEMFFTASYVHHLLNEEMVNKCAAVKLLRESMTLMQNNEKIEQLQCIIAAKSINFLRSYPDLATLYEFTKFLVTFPNCVPRGDLRATFCSAYIKALHKLAMPLKFDEIPAYMTNVESLAKFLKSVWESSTQDALFTSLQTILGLIATPGDENQDGEVPMSLVAVVQLLPTSMISDATKAVLNDRSLTDENMKIAMMCMMQWMSWVTASHINQWVLAFLKGLATLQRYSVLVEITLSTVELVYEKLSFPVVRDGAMSVLSYMLMSYQHCPEAFHKIASLIPNTIQNLQQENTPSSRKCMENLAELAHCQMYLHSGFPDLYDPILEDIKEYDAPAPEVIQRHLAESKWTAQCIDVITSPSSASVVKKSETGKIGLVNLGNTCYMNSVLQALYMCDDFRRAVLSSPIHPQNRVLLKLQHSFAHLKLSQRAAYSPTAFLNASRPPWFTQGHQQDCSEYLRHLLVLLHEQEQAARKETSHKEEKMETEQSETNKTLIDKIFTGKLETTHCCLKCGKHSSRTESFIDLSLPFPDTKCDEGLTNGAAKGEKLAGGDSSSSVHEAAVTSSSPANTDVKDLKDKGVCLSKMVDFFLAPETLHGDNCYHCDHCESLQDAERTIQITAAPHYLVLSLLRFSYDVKSQSRSKLLKDVKYPKVLYLPVMTEYPQCNGQSATKAPKTVVNHEMYCLNAVIIHAGLSSDCGHYYSYARHQYQGEMNSSEMDIGETNNDELNASSTEKWFLFNDNRVSFSSYESFSSVTKRFSRDTAYVLFYKKMTKPGDHAENGQLNEWTEAPIRRDLKEAVERDNRAFFEEQERTARLKSRQKRSSNFGASPPFFRYPDDDKGGPPGSCGGGGGFGGLNNDGPRFVF
ncbi:ubiquitin carboxyl-terminal hydrolase 38-like [Lineus longissimus]|uniref:ubiquitin carboxyl-terminal hydrolase 38-like n=1 Tax=Lineus longissimus TaxID=88925 RepID=UPI002B4D09F6